MPLFQRIFLESGKESGKTTPTKKTIYNVYVSKVYSNMAMIKATNSWLKFVYTNYNRASKLMKNWWDNYKNFK